MRDGSLPVFDQDEEVMASLLCNVGVKRNLAKALVYLANVNESVSRNIELGAGLRQPEVSIAMREMRERGWIEEWEQKKRAKAAHLSVTVSPHNSAISSTLSTTCGNATRSKTKRPSLRYEAFHEPLE